MYQQTIHAAFINELQKLATFNPQQIQQQGQQMIQQGQEMVQNPLGAATLIRQRSMLAANNPATSPQEAAQLTGLAAATLPKTASLVLINAFVDEFEKCAGRSLTQIEYDALLKEASFGSALTNLASKATMAAKAPLATANNAAMSFMNSAGGQMMAHNPAMATTLMGQQLAGGIGQAVAGKAAGGLIGAGAKVLPQGFMQTAAQYGSQAINAVV
jgi:hypothetical protein